VRALRELLSADVLDAAHAKRAANIISASERIAGSVTGRWGNAASYEILCTLCRAPGSDSASGSAYASAVDEFPAFYAAIASIRARLKCRVGDSRYL